MVKESEARLGERVRGLETVGQRIERLDARLQEFEGTVKDVKASVEALASHVAKLTVRVPTDSAETLYASAQAHYRSRNLGQAVLELGDLIRNFPRHPLAENAQYLIGSAYLTHQDFRQALIELRKVLDQYPGGNKAPDVLYQIGLCYRSLFEPQRAQEVWGKGYSVKIVRAEGKAPCYIIRAVVRLDNREANKLSARYRELGFPNIIVPES